MRNLLATRSCVKFSDCESVIVLVIRLVIWPNRSPSQQDRIKKNINCSSKLFRKSTLLHSRHLLCYSLVRRPAMRTHNQKHKPPSLINQLHQIQKYMTGIFGSVKTTVLHNSSVAGSVSHCLIDIFFNVFFIFCFYLLLDFFCFQLIFFYLEDARSHITIDQTHILLTSAKAK